MVVIPAISFADLLEASEARVLALFCRLTVEAAAPTDARIEKVARRFQLTAAQLLCGLGFNRHGPHLHEVHELLGLRDSLDLARRRNRIFVSDIYCELSREDVLAIYQRVRSDPESLHVMQYLLAERLRRIEQAIENTVNSLVIERYKKEMRAIYLDGIAQLEFAEERLARTDSGFRALLNEVDYIVDSRLVPIGDIFFRNSVLPQEKRRLIQRGLVPRYLVEHRLEEPDIPPQERRMLEAQLKSMK